MSGPSSREDLTFKLRVLIAWRAAIITIFLGSLAFFQPRLGLLSPERGISLLVAGTYLLTLTYAILLPRISRLIFFSYLQILGDLAIESGITYLTGGIESPFSFLYILSIISASIILNRSGGYFIAALATILYGSLADLEFYQFIEPMTFYHLGRVGLGAQYFLHTVFLNVSAFFLVAFLSGYLAENLWKTGKELKEKKVAWEELQAFHENIVKNIDSGLFTAGLDGRINSFNQAAERITGYSSEVVQGLFCHQLFDFLPFQDGLEWLLGRTPMAIAPHRHEGTFLHKEGQEIFLGMNLSPFRDEGGTVKGIIGVFQDITDRKEMEEQIRQVDRLTTIGQVSARMAHEIRNPLASISGSIQLLRGEPDLSESNRRLMDIVITETERLNQLLTDFLTYARPQPPALQPYDIHQILEETILLLHNGRAQSPQVNVLSALHPGEKPLLKIDPYQMKQVFWNLCLNALQSMPSGGTLRLSTRIFEPQHLPKRLKAHQRSITEINRQSSQGNLNSPILGFAWMNAPCATRSSQAMGDDRPLALDCPPMETEGALEESPFLEVTIADTGAGISPRDRARIFDPFYTTKDRGNGLGLAIVYRIIEEHHGFIDLESEPGKGAAFRVYLPIRN